MGCLKNLNKIAVCILVVIVCCQFGCRPQQPLFLGETGRWQQHYIDRATQIEIPNVNVRSLPEVCHTIAPFTLDNPDPSAMWELTLEEAMHITLKNSTVIRTLSGVSFTQGGVGGVPGSLLGGRGNSPTVFDPALIESDPRFGQEAALAAFDAQLTASARWDRNDPSRFGAQNAGIFQLGLSKYTAPGTQFYLRHENTVDGTLTAGAGANAIRGNWHTTSFTGGFTHPLLRGGGIEFNRIAGPNAFPGQYGGVAIARINTDMSLADFEMQTRTLVADVERAYWHLYYAYHRLESVRSGREAARRTWQDTRQRSLVGHAQGNAQNLAQAEMNYFQFRLQTETAQTNLFRAERALRYIMGLSPTDGRLIRPIDEPITAPIALDWHNVLCEALFRSPELRRQKWAVKQRELELKASRNFLLPRLDLEGGYRIGGQAWHNWTGRDGSYSELGNSHNGWMGLTASMPLGWRQEQAAARNAELNLTRARAMLREKEFELTHQLGDSFTEISLAYQAMQTSLAMFMSATREVQAMQIAYETEVGTLDLVLRAQQRASEAQTQYYHSVIEYNLAIMMLHFRKGSLLEYNNICLSEGEWPGKAYFDARRRARERDAGRYFNYGLTLPGVLSRGEYQQHQHGYNSSMFDVLPSTTPSSTPTEWNPQLAPAVPAASSFNGGFTVVEPNPVPVPTLPSPGGNVSASYTSGVSTPSLTPSRNMRYVR